MLLPIRPAELGKTTNTTFTTSYNLLCVAILLQGKQQNTTFLVNHELKQSLLKLCHGAKKCHKMEHLRLECASLLSWPDFVIAYPKKYKSYNFSRQECKKQGFSRIGGRACYFTRLFARLPKQQKQPLIIKHLQTYFEKVTKSGKWNTFALNAHPYCPGEALFIVVSLAATLGLHGPRRGDVPAKRCYLL